MGAEKGVGAVLARVVTCTRHTLVSRPARGSVFEPGEGRNAWAWRGTGHQLSDSEG